MQSERAVSSRPEHFRAGTIIDALDVTMPDEHHYSTNDARAPRSTVAAGTARLRTLQDGSAPRAKSPLITAVEIENFKGIGRPVRIDLRPITLLFGRNSAGKSTILHALCYAYELLSHGRVDAGRTELGGAQVDLGGFKRFVHAHDRDREIRFRFDLNLEGWTVPARLWEKMKRPNIEPELADEYEEWIEAHDPAMSIRSGWVELAVTWARLFDQPVLASYEVGVNDSLAGRIVWTDSFETGVNLEFNWAHPLFDPLRCHQPGDSRPAPSRAAAGRARETLDPSTDEWRLHRVEVYGLTRLPDWDELLGFNVEDLSTDREHGISSPGSPNLPRFRALVSGVFMGIGDRLRNELAKLRYIGPVRKLRPRVKAEPGSADQESWSDGSAAWNRLLPAPPDPSRPDFLKEVNDWLARNDRLDTGYRLTRKSTVELSAETPPVSWIRFRDRLSAECRNEHGAVDLDRWAKGLAATIANLHYGDPDDIETRIKADPGDRDESADENPAEQTNSPEEELVDVVRERYQCLVNLDRLEKGHHPSAVGALVAAIAAAPARTELQLVAAESELPIRTSDIGVGISQLLPVVVAALDPGRPGITAIEQPELHLHPAMQVELGDLFAQPVDDGRVFLLENHSEHLMLRLLRRIEETHSGELPEGKPALRPDQVAVVFLEQVDGEVRATPLRIDETGEFIDRWPHGFFRERAAELF